MYRAKYQKHKKRHSRPVILLSSLALLLVLAVGGTIAYLMTNTSSVTNTFQPARVTCEVEEQEGNAKFDGKVKENIPIKNTGNVDAYIRAAVLVNWVNKEGKIIPRPAEDGFGHRIEMNPTGWTLEADGYYYYKDKVAPGGKTAPLILQAYPTKSNAQYTPSSDDIYFLQIDIIADAIQADGMGATTAQAAWEAAKGTN